VGEDTCSCQRGRPAVFAGEGFLGRVSPLVTIVQVPTPTSAGDPNTWSAVAENRLCAENQALFGYTDLNDTAPQWRRRGIGTEVLSGLERLALAEGRHTLHSWLAQVGDVDPEGPGVIAPARGQRSARRAHSVRALHAGSWLRTRTGRGAFGAAGAGAPAGAGAARRRGRRESGRRVSPDQLDRPVPRRTGGRLRRALRRHGRRPDRGHVARPAHWDAERVREGERRCAEAGIVVLVHVAQQVSTGDLTGFTQLNRYADRADSAFQDDTVVVAAHRGHRLGMHLKVANLRLMNERWPQVRRVHTWNADENDHMRSINIALGFRAESSEGAWQEVPG